MNKTGLKNNEEILDVYYRDNAKILREMADKILRKLSFYNVDNEDFYSLANEIFIDALKRYDGKQSFDGFLYICLMNKFKSEMTKRNRLKRQADKNSVSMDTPIDEKENCTLADLISDDETVEKKIFENTEQGYSDRMRRYLNKLSTLEKRVLQYISVGYTVGDIIKELHIDQKTYENCHKSIYAYDNISILM